jgi:hypothetical protein
MMKRAYQIGVLVVSLALLAGLPGCLFGPKATVPKPTKQQEERAQRNAEKLKPKGANTLKEAETGEGFPHF